MKVILCTRMLEEKGASEGWVLLKQELLRAQAMTIPVRQKHGRGSKKPIWINSELQEALRGKKEMYKQKIKVVTLIFCLGWKLL